MQIYVDQILLKFFDSITVTADLSELWNIVLHSLGVCVFSFS